MNASTEGWAARAAMSPVRLGVAGLIIALYLVIQAHQVVTEADDWPFSSYPMYSWKQGPVISKKIVLGVSREGEFELTRQHTTPLVGSRLRHVVGALRQKRGREALEVFAQRYNDRNAARGRPWPELHGIRQYQLVWRIQPELKGMDKPSKRLLSSVLTLSPERKQALLAEGRGKAEPRTPRPASPGDIVLGAQQAKPTGKVTLKSDRYAAQGEALVFPRGPGGKKPPAAPEHAAHFTFEAEPGKYWVWLRGKSAKGTRADSVWLAIDKQVGSRSTSFKQGAGNFRDGYPAKAYAWSSSSPAAPPIAVKLKGRKHVLVVSAREGPLMIDQIVLSRYWREHPLDDGPVRQP